MTNRKCSVKDCVGKYYIGRYCSKHYQRMRTHGTTDKPVNVHIKHGLSHTVEYGCWLNMMSRCYKKENKGYKHWGGRGIKVFEKWHKFENFYKDMAPRPDGLTLERIDNEKDYSPDNCKWATWKEQLNNTTRSKEGCVMNDCNKTHYALGLCQKHYMQNRRA